MEPVGRDEQGFDAMVLNQGTPHWESWPAGFTVSVEGTRPVDYLLPGPWLSAISERARAVIEQHTGPDDVEFLPTTVAWKKNPEPAMKYWILNVLKCAEALDWEHTRWSTKSIPYDHADAHLEVIVPALKRDLISGCSIFVLSVGRRVKSGIYMSATLRWALESARAAVGMYFMPIPTY